MVHRFGDLFNPPALTNFLGCVQADLDPVAIRSFNVPPYSCSDVATGSLFIDRTYFHATGAPVTFWWYPDRIVREATHAGVNLRSTTVMAVGRTVAMVYLEIENRSESSRSVELRLGLKGGITKSTEPWTNAIPPLEYEHDIAVDQKRKAVTFVSLRSGAASVQGAFPLADRADPTGLDFQIDLGPREVRTFSFVNALGDSLEEATSLYDEVAGKVPEEIERSRADWNEEIEAIFSPENSRYSGSLPSLETEDPDIRRIYQMGALGVAYFKRDSPHSVAGRAYDTLMPRYWSTVTFLWDYSLSSLVHAFLDPDVMRKYLEQWMKIDVHRHFGTEWLTGGPVGPWYSVNDFAMVKIARDYLRFSGDVSWLHTKVAPADAAPRRVIDQLEEYATSWRSFRTPHGLADYGDVNNLLECVSSYVHEVASLNAANVFNLRTVADLLEMNGEASRAESLREEAGVLVTEVQRLYAEGKGYWHARFPDGSLVPVRHCYDFITVLGTIADDLKDSTKKEMARFFLSELKTPAWMHALSPADPDALFSVRPDHQWTGAYPAWPPLAVSGLWRIGEVDAAFEWLKGLARTANQGPFGQAHFAEPVVPAEDGGARKAPSDFPWINDWSCASNGSWCSVVIESIFGVHATVDRGISAEPRFGPFDPSARLRNLRYQGSLYDVDASGIHPAAG